jgi:hypothetical protein
MACGSFSAQLTAFLAANGVDATYYRSATTGYDTSTGKTTRSEVSTAIKGAFVNAHDFLMAGVGQGEARPRTGHRKFTIAGDALSVKPAVNDRITILTENFKVSDVEAHAIGATAMAYTLTLDRA